jgi:predicted anti-sigma-YlaC factor YlaD
VRPAVCDRSRAWISLRLDGEISQIESALLRAHLTVCTDCRHFGDDVAWQTEQLRAASVQRRDIPVSIPRRRNSFVRRPLEVGTAVAAAAAASIALVVGIGGSHTRSDVPQQRLVPESSVGLLSPSLGLPAASGQNVQVMRKRLPLPQI